MKSTGSDQAARWRDVDHELTEEILALLEAQAERAVSRRWGEALEAASALLRAERAPAGLRSPSPDRGGQ